MSKSKYIITGLFIALILFFITSVIFSYINRNQSICVKSYDNYEQDMKVLSEKVDKVKNETCRVSLKYLLDRIKDNHFEGCVKLKDYYESFYKDDFTFVDYYNYVATSCNINNNELYVKAMSTLVYPAYIKNKYNRAYEFYIEDYYFYDKDIDDMGSYSTLVNEITVLSDLLKELS